MTHVASGRVFCAVIAAVLACLLLVEASSGWAAENGGAGPVFNAKGPQLSRFKSLFGGFPSADRSNWIRVGFSVDGFSRLDELFPANVVEAPEIARPWQRPALEPELFYQGSPQIRSGRFSIDQYLDRNPATGLLVAHGDEILVERYQYDRNDSHRLTSFSMAKTIAALLIGLAVEDSFIASIDDPVAKYVPDLEGSEYGRTPIRHVLTMASGIRFTEDYTGDDDVARLSRETVAQGGAGGAETARSFNVRNAEPGETWHYKSVDTYVLALVLRGAVGKPLASYLSEKVWQPMGAEAPASWVTEKNGIEVGFMGFNAVLRDYARLGMLFANGGRVDGKQIVPEAWIRDMTRAHYSPDQTGRYFGYGYQTWIFPTNDGTFAFLGVRGQGIYVDPQRKLVLVHTAVFPQARDRAVVETIALWFGLRRALPTPE